MRHTLTVVTTWTWQLSYSIKTEAFISFHGSLRVSCHCSLWALQSVWSKVPSTVNRRDLVHFSNDHVIRSVDDQSVTSITRTKSHHAPETFGGMPCQFGTLLPSLRLRSSDVINQCSARVADHRLVMTSSYWTPLRLYGRYNDIHAGKVSYRWYHALLPAVYGPHVACIWAEAWRSAWQHDGFIGRILLFTYVKFCCSWRMLRRWKPL